MKERIFRKLIKVFEVLPEEKQSLQSAFKRQILQQSSGLQAFIKKRPQHGCFPVNIPKVLGTAFFVEQFRLLFFNYVLVSEKFF